MNQQVTNRDGDAQDGYGVVTEPGPVSFERLLPGPIERVWSYLTESDKRRTWLASGEMELQVGGRVELIWRNSELTGHDDPPPPKYAQHGAEHRMQGRITACEPPRLLAFTWGSASGDSEVRFELFPRADKVMLVLTHHRLRDMLSVAGGWHAHLGILRDRLNGDVPPAFWKTHARLEAEYAQRIATDQTTQTK